MQIDAGNNIDVLIVGAGPTGLMMASQLAVRNISFRIIDKNEHSSRYSGAMILQARSIEIIEQLGLAKKAILDGTVANEIIFVFNGRQIASINIKNLGLGFTEYPYLLMIEQPKIEKLFIDFITNLNVEVERELELVNFTEHTDGIVSTLKHSDGKEEQIKSKYIVGADGSHSVVRKQLNIPFNGITYPIPLFITDCHAHFDFSHDVICFSISKGAIAGFFPLADGKWRIDGAFTGKSDSKYAFTFNDIEKEFAKRTQIEIQLYDPQWFSVFHSSNRIADTFRLKRCFLAGDSAHVQSPIGAQGMNSGMQDAYNLAWKLALVIQNKAKPILLDTYSAERKPVAKNLLRFTNKVFKIVINQDYFTRNFRMHTLPFLLKFINPLIRNIKVRRLFFEIISEIGIRYNKSVLCRKRLSDYFSFKPKCGERLPYLIFNQNGKEVNIQKKITGKSFHLFIFNKNKLSTKIINVVNKYKDVLTFEHIDFTKGTKNVYRYFGVRESGLILVRPDMHIAFVSLKTDTKMLEDYLQNIF
jgi:2-polyprenyl-6-methoxyphenol hydroxylase-like FAD-dependent oxidoreductase